MNVRARSEMFYNIKEMFIISGTCVRALKINAVDSFMEGLYFFFVTFRRNAVSKIGTIIVPLWLRKGKDGCDRNYDFYG